MNFGTYDIEQVILKQIAMGVTVQCKGGQGKFVKDLAKNLYAFLEENMHSDIKVLAAVNGIDKEIVAYAERICNAFSFATVQLTPIAIGVYKWMMEQEEKGQTVEKFADWARQPERAKFINKYRKDAGNFKNDWVLAFEAQETKGGGYDEVRI